MERELPRWQAPDMPVHRCAAAVVEAPSRPPTTSTLTSPPTAKESFAGVRLSCTADMPPWEMRSALGWGPRTWSPPVEPGPPEEATGAGATVPPPGNANDVVVLPAAAAVPRGGGGEQPEVAPAVSSMQSGAGRGSGVSPTIPPREERILVFLKTLGLNVERDGVDGDGARGKGCRGGTKEEDGGCSDGEGGSGGGGDGSQGLPVYLTHAVLRRRSPLRSLFELAAKLLPEGVAPEELGAYIEELPCVWQGVPAETAGREAVRACVSFVVGGWERVGGRRRGDFLLLVFVCSCL